MITALYTSVCAFIFVRLSLNVIRLRRREKIGFGDGGIKALQVAIAAHSNAAQYIPIALLLLFCLEYNGASGWLVHPLGLALVAGRIIHARGMATGISGRVLGMQITITTIIILASANILLVLYKQLFA